MSPNQHPIDSSTLPAGTSGTFTRQCACGATVRFIDTAEQPHDHTRERIEVSAPEVDLAALRIDVVTASNFDIDSSSHPWTLVDPGHLIEAIARAEAAEAKVEAVRALHRKVHEFGRQYVCAECSPIEDNLYLNIVKYPCPTIRALKRTP